MTPDIFSKDAYMQKLEISTNILSNDMVIILDGKRIVTKCLEVMIDENGSKFVLKALRGNQQ